jgi:hypothetical protein
VSICVICGLLSIGGIITMKECALWTKEVGVNKDCEDQGYPECNPCTRRQAKQLKDLVGPRDPDTSKIKKIFQCDDLTAQKGAVRDCPGKKYPGCLFCTKKA